MTPYRWNTEKSEWQFYEPAFGGWTTLRIGPHVSTRPMTFKEGIEYLVTYPMVLGREAEAPMWLYGAVQALNVTLA